MTSRTLKAILILGFTVELLRACLLRVLHCLQNCFRNVPTGLKGSRYTVDRVVDTKPPTETKP